jgi:hypothetical protein
VLDRDRADMAAGVTIESGVLVEGSRLTDSVSSADDGAPDPADVKPDVRGLGDNPPRAH